MSAPKSWGQAAVQAYKENERESLRPRPRNIRGEVRRRILSQPCAICGGAYKLHVDHITPVSKGGSGSEENLQPLCWQCNHKKGNRLTNEELRAWYLSRKEEHDSRAAAIEAWELQLNSPRPNRATAFCLEISGERKALQSFDFTERLNGLRYLRNAEGGEHLESEAR